MSTLRDEKATIGERRLGEFARSQLEMARQDPRLRRGPEAMVADFWDGLEEIERVRTLSSAGIRVLQNSLQLEEQQLGKSVDDPALSESDAASLQAAWERAEWAKAEVSNGMPHLNAQALVSMASALDAYVEDFVASNLRFLINSVIARYENIRERLVTEGNPEIPDKRSLKDALEKASRRADRPRGHGLDRYETHLSHIGLSAPVDRPIPAGLSQALAELTALRNVLVHRAARVDDKALLNAPSLGSRYREGDLVRTTSADYRVYSAAVRCYAQEILFRAIRHWPEVSDLKDGPNLVRWRDYYRIGA